MVGIFNFGGFWHFLMVTFFIFQFITILTSSGSDIVWHYIILTSSGHDVFQTSMFLTLSFFSIWWFFLDSDKFRHSDIYSLWQTKKCILTCSCFSMCAYFLGKGKREKGGNIFFLRFANTVRISCSISIRVRIYIFENVVVYWFGK